ncbi:isochorismate synthase [Shewanella sp. D64]|uniref:isochorismate synthase n=1 Tax=unclassified Shewanella TaxID=196818 RepID=UPI0022BA6240|nr:MULTISPECIES: isochorismate synthase [unclassified Shewanella]MEC4727576.1 isochorismate synthase [Shewanella sp. D64]MEC4739827.1 isochorismate synthase [Shewanella sp. E94]WBJ95787.1 isochorismate synthase [Shewanella sp. MTB7]
MAVYSLSLAVSSLTDTIKQLKFQAQNDPIIQLSLPIKSVPAIAWLAAQPCYPRIYWKGRDTEEEVAAVGCCKDFFYADDIDDNQLSFEYQKQRALSNNQDIRYYGGVAFDRTTECWPEFGRAHFVLPRIELRRDGNDYKLLVNLNFDSENAESERNKAIESLAELAAPKPLPPPNKINLLSRSDRPNRYRWTELVNQVTHQKFIQETPKVVLSRLTQLEVNQPVDPWMLLACWQGRNQNSFQFGFQFSADSTFISCTPERLYRRRQRELFTEALAGTTTRGLNLEEDRVLAQNLLEDNKNSHENRLVKDHIVDALTPLSSYVGADSTPKVFKLSHIQHLHRSIRAELKPGIDDFQVLQALHPTPAVGGLPREPAMSFIRQSEGYARGWYAGACGYFNKHESEFAVAIRSALIEPGRINLFAGAGIVSGSEADAEWVELENKLTTILSILTEL